MNIVRVILFSIGLISLIMMVVTLYYEELSSKIRQNETTTNPKEGLIVEKENANSFLKSKRQLSTIINEGANGGDKDNYEILLEQIYTERSICINQNGKIVNDGVVDKKTCERFCENYSCEEEPIKVCGDNTWTNYKNSCYKVATKRLNWLQAHAKCKESNSTLVVINDSSVQAFITNWLKTTESIGDEFFVGLQRKPKKNMFLTVSSSSDKNSDWQWVNGEQLLFSNWNENEPNNDGDIEDCVELIMSSREREQGRWNDISCDLVQRKYICEKAADTSSVRNKDDIVYEFMKFREVNEENVVQFIDLLNDLTSKNASTFTAGQVTNIANVLAKVSNLTYFPMNATKGFFGTINNLLYAPDEVYAELKNVSNTLLKTVDIITAKIRMLQRYNVSSEIKVQIPNIAASINDISLDLRGRNDDIWQTFKTSDDETATVVIKTDFVNKLNRNTPSMSTGLNTSMNEYSVNGDNQTTSDTMNRYRLVIVYYKNKKLFQSSLDACMNEKLSKSDACKRQYNSKVSGTIVSVNVNTFNESVYEKESDLVDYDIKHTKNPTDVNSTIWCGYWVFRNGSEGGGGYWSSEGCEYVSYNEATGYHKCRCNHTTHYSLLFAPQSSTEKYTETEILILSIVTYIGLALSVFGLLVTLITYAFFKTLRQGIIHKSLIMLAICLLVSDYLFLQISFAKPSINKSLCLITAVLLHYSLLVSFMWMLTIAIAQYLTFVKIINNHIHRFMLKASFMSFGLPLIMPLTIVILDVNNYYNRTLLICWLHGPTLYASFVAPIIVICLINAGFFVSILYSIFNRPVQFKTSTSVRRNQIGASLCCFVLMGFTWIAGFTLLFDYPLRIVSEVVFCVLNTTQGFLIFLFHVLLSKTKRDLWSQLVNKNGTGGKHSNVHKTISNQKSNSSNQTSSSVANSSTKKSLGPFKQSIQLNIDNLAATNMNSNQIILSNNNNIIFNDSKIPYMDDDLITSSTTSSSTMPTRTATAIQQPFFLTPQHHHYHHHIHHHKNQLKRKKRLVDQQPQAQILAAAAVDSIGRVKQRRQLSSARNSF